MLQHYRIIRSLECWLLNAGHLQLAFPDQATLDEVGSKLSQGVWVE